MKTDLTPDTITAERIVDIGTAMRIAAQSLNTLANDARYGNISQTKAVEDLDRILGEIPHIADYI